MTEFLKVAEPYLNILAYILVIMFGALAKYYKANKKLQSLITKAVDNSEEMFDGTRKKGEMKLDIAITKLYEYVPVTLRPFITKKLIKDMINSSICDMESYAKKQLDKTVDEIDEKLFPTEKITEKKGNK